MMYLYDAAGLHMSDDARKEIFGYNFDGSYGVNKVAKSAIDRINRIRRPGGIEVGKKAFSARQISSYTYAAINEFIISVRTTPIVGLAAGQYDYHFAILLNDGTWADKRGELSARRGKINPLQASWSGVGVFLIGDGCTTTISAGYDSDILFIAVRILNP